MASKHNNEDDTGRWWKIILATVAGTATGYVTGSALEQQMLKRFDGVKAPFFRRLFRSAE
jgi:hypothetical protein